MSLRLESLAMPEVPVEAVGQPLSLSVDAIDEDPEQPRSDFDPVTLQELADSIALRGVRQPISVRPHPSTSDRWMLNFGARRLRASKLSGRIDIPAFVDKTADSYDQVIENEQREKLTALELALFIQRRLAAGDRQAEIARRIGKSRQYVTLATALVDAPDWLMSVYRERKCRGLNELYELRRLHDADAEAVEAWLIARPTVSRSDLDALRESVAAAHAATHPAARAPLAGLGLVVASDSAAVMPLRGTRSGPAPAPLARHADASDRSVPAVFVFATFGGATVRVATERCPPEPDEVFVRGIDDGREETVKLRSLADVCLVRSDRA